MEEDWAPSERDSSQFSARRWDHSPVPALSVILFDRGDCRMSIWTEDDKQIAARALKTLEQARVASRGAAIYCLEPVRGEMASKRPDDIPERADAWLAVCRLCEALVEPDSEEPVSKWRMPSVAQQKAERLIGDDYPLNPKPAYFFAGPRSQALSRYSRAHMRQHERGLRFPAREKRPRFCSRGQVDDEPRAGG